LRAYASCYASDPFMEEGLAHWLVEAERGWRHASLLPLSILSGPCRFWKSVRSRVSSSSLARASADEVTSRLPAQPAFRSKPASQGLRRGDPWDVSQQMALPLAYPDSHPPTLAPETGEVS
jgi:hypothetical protein